jgi:hypothetical protein
LLITKQNAIEKEVGVGASTQESLELWYDFIQEVSGRWGELMDEAWADLPPDVCDSLLSASTSFADSIDKLKEYLNLSETDTISE